MSQLTNALAAPTIAPAVRFVQWLCHICRLPGIPANVVAVVDGRPVYGCTRCATAPAEPVPPATGRPAGDTCPPWCSKDAHRHPVDVEHESDMRDLASSSLRTGDRYGDVVAQLRQQPGGAARIALAVCTDRDDQEVELALGEALQVAWKLINAVNAARAADSR